MVQYETQQKLQFTHERAIYARDIAEAVALLHEHFPPGVRYTIYPAPSIEEFSPGVDLLDPVIGADGARLRDIYRARKPG